MCDTTVLCPVCLKNGKMGFMCERRNMRRKARDCEITSSDEEQLPWAMPTMVVVWLGLPHLDRHGQWKPRGSVGLCVILGARAHMR